MKLPTFKKALLPGVDQSFETAPSVVEKNDISLLAKIKQADKKLKLLLVLVPVTLVLVILSLVVRPAGESGIGRGAQLTPTPTQTAPARALSPYADDEAIVAQQEKLRELEEKMGQVDLNQAALNPPVLEWKIEF